MVYGGGFPLLIKVSNKLIPWFGDEDQAMERYLRRRRERRPPKATWPVQVKQNIWKKNTLVNLNQLKETAVNFWKGFQIKSIWGLVNKIPEKTVKIKDNFKDSSYKSQH